MNDLKDILKMLDTRNSDAQNRNNHTEISFLKMLSDVAYELQEYRKLGTVEEIKRKIEGEKENEMQDKP